MIRKKVFHSFLILYIIAVSFSFTSIADAAPAQVVARTGQPAVGVPGWTYNGLFADNNPTFTALPAPMLAGDLVAMFSTLRQGASTPVSDKGIWLLNQSGSGRVVGRRGQPAPDTEAGTVYDSSNSNNFSTNHITNVAENGRLFFMATMSGPAIDPGVNDQGLWKADIDDTELVIRNGQVAPETSPVGHFYSLSEGMSFDGTAEGADVGIRAFVTSLPGEPATLPMTRGAWARIGQNLEMLYWSYGIVLGIPNVLMVEAEAIFSSSGRGAYFGRLDGTGVTTVIVNGFSITNDWVLFRTGPGYSNLITRKGFPAPGTAEGVVFRTLPIYEAKPAVNSAGDVVFQAMLAGPGVTSSNWTGLWKSTESGVSLLVRGGQPAPAAGTGVVFGGISANATAGTLHVMDNGDTVFATGMGGQGGTLANASAVYKIKADNTHELIVRAGTAHLAFPAGVTLVRTTLPQVMKAIGNDHVMFTAQFSGTGVTSTNDDVLMRHTNSGGLQLIAREGEQIGNFILKSFVSNGADLQLTDNYYAVVSATFSPASNPTATPQPGILGISPTGETSVLAVKGSSLELSDGTTPTINSLRLSPKSALNESGKVVFSAKLNPTAVRDEIVAVASIEDSTQTCPADFDQNGTADVSDIFVFLSAWFAQSPTADVDDNGQVQVPDIFTFLTTWFAGC